MTSRLLRRWAFLLFSLPSAAIAQAPGGKDTLHMVFVGDLNFGRSLATNYIFTGKEDDVLAAVRNRLRAADVTVGNLESIILDRGRYADTTNSPVFAGPLDALRMLKDAGFDVLGNANNHAWDFGHAGLIENIAHLDSAGFLHSGTGPNLGAAWRPAVVRVKGWTIAIFSLAAIFNYPDLTVTGHSAECCVAWADTLRAAERFRTVRDSLGADLVIAFVHAGLEYHPDPEPDVVMRFRALTRAGADIVIGHHPHVPQGVEVVGGKTIVYSLGNFVFKQGQPWTNRALWAEVVVTEAPRHREAEAPEQQCTAPSVPRCLRASVRLTLSPLAVGYTPTFLTGPDSAAVMAHVDSISRRIPAHPRLPNHRSGRYVAHPHRATTKRKH